MGNGESSPQSYAQQIRFSDGYAERENFDREPSNRERNMGSINYAEGSSAFVPDNFNSIDQVTSTSRDYRYAERENFNREPPNRERDMESRNYAVGSSTFIPDNFSPLDQVTSTSRDYGYAERQNFNRGPPNRETKLERRNYAKGSSTFIPDNFSSLDQVTSALRDYGLESSNLILGIDFTKSNEWTGRHSFHRKSLHAIGSIPNPYEQAVSIIGRTLSPFDDDNLIPCFGFGDATTHDRNVFSFYPDHRACQGFEEALARYREILPFIKLSGPTSFAPLIYAAVDIVEKSNWQYHVLVIVADGQVTTSPDTPPGKFSPQEKATVDAIVAASAYPLSIIMVGVGDGPWDMMQKFDDCIPQRSFDNFQFVNFTKIMSTNMEMAKKEAAFALAALMEVPFQYRATQSLKRFESENASVGMSPLPPPQEVIEYDEIKLRSQTMPAYPSTGYSSSRNLQMTSERACPICLTNSKDMAFGCGHLTCKDCGTTLLTCPLCRTPIVTRIRLYS